VQVDDFGPVKGTIPSVQQLVDSFFTEEVVEYRCEGCKKESSRWYDPTLSPVCQHSDLEQRAYTCLCQHAALEE
jgi:hypothetical protein